MRWLRFVASAAALAAWLAGSAAQQPGTPPPSTPPAGAPARTPPASTPQQSSPQPATPADEGTEEAQQAAADVDEDEFIPTEELQPDAAVTFPVDI